MRPMRIVSLLPAATEIVAALGLADELVGRSCRCDAPPGIAAVPALTIATEPRDRLDVEALVAAAPDLILTQELCTVCAVGADEVRAIARERIPGATVVSLEPDSVEGILNAVATVGAYAEAEDEAVGLVEILRERLGEIEARVQERRLAGIPPRRVVVLEWVDPPFASGHWIPEMVRRAGGWELLGREGAPAVPSDWERVREIDPELIVVAACGMDARAAAEAWAAAPVPGWIGGLRAARDRAIVAVDGDGLFARPGPRVVEGIALLARLFDPDGFADLVPETGAIVLPAPAPGPR